MELESAPSPEKSGCHKSCTVSQNADNESKTIKKPTCCHSEKWIFPEENAVKNDQHLTNLLAVVLVHFFPTHLLVENTFQQPVDVYLDPDPTADLQVLFQSFLI